MKLSWPGAEQSLFPLGTHLCREPMPDIAELKTDMEMLRDRGFTLIKIQESWFNDEPEEGRFEFGPIEELVAHASELNLGVYLGLTCEQAPLWLWEKHPDIAMETLRGNRVSFIGQTPIPADAKPGPCPDHPALQKAQERFITELVRTLGTYDSIVVWNTWQEIGYWSERIAGGRVCYCPHTIEHFRHWLKSKYQDVDSLNEAWRSRYASIDSIVPHRTDFRTCNPVDIDWNAFLARDFITQTLKRRHDAIKSADPQKRPVFAHIDKPIWGSGTPWFYADCQDFLGSSTYPTWFSREDWDDLAHRTGPQDRHGSLVNETWDSIYLRFDCVRSASHPTQPMWAAEVQGGPVSTGLHWGRTPEPSDIRRWIAGLLATDATAISFWVTRPEVMAHEVNGYSLLDGLGDSTARFEAVCSAADTLHRHAELFTSRNLEKRDVGILVNEANHALLSSLANDAEEHLGYVTRGWHRLLWESGLPCDFVNAESDEALASYKLLILPLPFSLGSDVASRLVDYVGRGGYLLSEACAGRLNQHGFSTRAGLAEPFVKLFGVVHDGLSMVREPNGEERYSPYERGWGEFREPGDFSGAGPFAGLRVEPSFYRETFRLTSDGKPETVFTSDNEVTGVRVQFGAGRAILIGTFLGYQGTAHRNESACEFVRKLISDAGIETPESTSVITRCRDNGKSIATIVFNASSERQDVALPSVGMSHSETLFGSPLKSGSGNEVLILPPLEAEVVIQTRSSAAENKP